jgi:hypothetical protein
LTGFFSGCGALIDIDLLQQHIASVVDSKVDFAAWLEV